MKITTKKISDFINKEYKEYAVYSLESRGIPSFYDGLTNSQRFIIQNSPRSFVKSMKIIGDAISAGFHHGNSSLEGTLNTLTRPFLCSEPILDGDGFFGNPINQDAAAARYTSAKLSKRSQDVISKFKDLNEKNLDGGWDLLHVDTPLGLLTSTTGIAVGYACKILPRKQEHIEAYFKGTRKNIKPFLNGYTGEIVENKDNPGSSWIIKPNIDIDSAKKTITILDFSPTVPYATFIKNLNSILEDHKCTVVNNSRDKVNITLKFNRNLSEDVFVKIGDMIEKKATTTFTENIVFIKDGSVLEYDKIEDYLEDFKNYREFLFRDKIEYDLSELELELAYLLARLEYLKFMLAKKRKESEVETFLKKYDSIIYSRLDSIKLRNLNTEYQKKTESLIKEIKADIASTKKNLKRQSQVCLKIHSVIQHAKSFTINN